MTYRLILISICMFYSFGSSATSVNFNFEGYIVNGSDNSPHREGGDGFRGEKYIGSIFYDTRGVELLNDLDGRYVYSLPSAFFAISFLETEITYTLETNGESSYLRYEIWNDYDLGRLSNGPQDRYSISFVSNQSIVFDFSALDFPFDGSIDTSLVESGEIPITLFPLLGFDSYHMQYTDYSTQLHSFNWGTSGVGTEPYSSVPLPAAIWFFGFSLFSFVFMKKSLPKNPADN